MNVFEAVKQSVTTRQAAEHYGIRVNRNGMCACPFHNDKTPSMKVDRRFHCFGCQADGDVIDFVSRLTGTGTREAAVMLAQDFSILYEARTPTGRSRPRPKAPPETPEQQFKRMERYAFRVLSDYYHLLRRWEKDLAPQINVMEEANFVAEHTLKDHSIDLTIYNVHEFPKLLDYQVIRTEEIVLILPEGHPLSEQAEKKPGFQYPWLNLNLLKDENFILLYPDQNTGGITGKLFSEYEMSPQILLHTRNSQMSITLAMDGMGAAFAPASYFHFLERERKDHPQCFSIGKRPVVTTTIAAYQPQRYLPQHARDYIQIIRKYCT